MADAATTSLSSILSGVADGRYVEIDEVPVFDEHDEHDAEGNLVRRFDRSRLQTIADVCNARTQSTGDLAPVGPGHTIPNQYDSKGILVRAAKEEEQPPTWGYMGHYRLGLFGPERKLGILAKIYAKAEHAEKIKHDFPRRSIELYPKDNIIDRLAVLRRSPQRDLGLLEFSREAQEAGKLRWCPWVNEVQVYTAGKKSLAACYDTQGKLRYAMDGYDEAKHKRDEGGKFSSSDHAANEMHGKDPGDIRNRLKKAGLKFHHDDVMEHLQKSAAMKPDQRDNWQIADHGKFHDVMHAAIHGTHRQTGKRVSDLREASDGDKKRYSMENDMAFPPSDDPANDPTKPPSDAVPAANAPLTPEEQAQADRMWKAITAKNPLLQYMCQYGMQMPSPTNMAPPAPVAPAPLDKPGGDPGLDMPGGDKPMSDDKDRMANESEAIRYARLEAEVKQLKAERTVDAQRYQRAEAEKLVIQAEAEGVVLDRADEVADIMKRPQADWPAHMARIKKNYQREERAPLGGPFLRLDDQSGPDERYGQTGGKERHEKAMQYMRTHPGTQYEAAVEAVSKAG